MSRGEQHEWDRISAVIIVAVMAIVCLILLPAALRAICKGDDNLTRSSKLTQAALCGCLSPANGDEPPPAGILVPVVVTHVTDGDTITVQITVEARVRLLDCWAPETRGGTEASKAKGLASKAHLAQIAEGRVGALFVPFDGAKTLGDVWSFDRILGKVWVDGTGDLARKQTLSGHAFRTKDELMKALTETAGP